MITDEFDCQSVDNDWRGLLNARHMDTMEYPPDPEGDICEHGMSAWLCMGPNHYPSRQDEIEGRFFL